MTTFASLLKSSETKHLRDKLMEEFPKPPLRIKADPLVDLPGRDYHIFGVGVDLLVNLTIAYFNKGKTIGDPTDSVASGFQLLKKDIQQHRSPIYEVPGRQYDRKELFYTVIDMYERTERNISKYLENGKLTTEFSEDIIFLAKLQHFVRYRSLNPRIEEYEISDVFELKRIRKNLDSKLFSAKKHCYLHPTVGCGSPTGACSPDLVIDNTLIDIKARKKMTVTAEDYRQILCYYLLSRIGPINNNVKAPTITQIGIYFARFGQLWTYPVANLGTEEQFKEMEAWYMLNMTPGKGLLA